MGYIENNLVPGEKVLVRGKNHVFLMIQPVVVTALVVLALVVCFVLLVSDLGILSFLGGLGAFFTALMLLGAIPACVGAVISYYTNECAVTNKRVIGKFGFIRRSTLEFPFRQIESIAFHEGLIDRLVGAATIRVLGSGAAWVETPILSNYKEFRQTALEQMEALHHGQPAGPAVVEKTA